jgi:hypothetical protein
MMAAEDSAVMVVVETGGDSGNGSEDLRDIRR